MKKLIASLTVLAAGAALASSVSSATTFGVLKITSDAPETAISVPWVSAGSDGTTETILVKDFVKTSNLTPDDELWLYDPTLTNKLGVVLGGFRGWRLTAGEWVPQNATIGTGADSVTYAADDNLTLNRGQALILIRQSVADTAIYLYGQYKDPSGVSCTITRAAERTTLFAPVNTSTTGKDLNNLTWDGAVTGDKIKLQGTIPVTFTYELDRAVGSRWGRYNSNSQWITTGATILPGQGAWYTTVAGSGDVEVSGF